MRPKIREVVDYRYFRRADERADILVDMYQDSASELLPRLLTPPTPPMLL